MDELPERYGKLLHQIEASGPGAGSRRTALESEIQAMLVHEQIESAQKVADAANAHAKSLQLATWVLSGATAVLAVATVVLVVVTAST